jgi:ABC-type antimicrobial peptide transport system permease subunit
LGGAYPARWAANLQPVEALRYEGGAGAETHAPQSASGLLSRRLGFLGLPFRNLWRRRMRTLISATGIGIGVATLVMLGGMSEGLMKQLNSLAGSAGAGNITLMQAKVADMSLSTLDERMVSQIQAMPGVKSVSPYLMGFVMTSDMPLFIIGGLDPNSGAIKHYKLVEGRHVARPNEIIVGKLAADNYKLETGDTVTLYDNRYKVVGIFETGVGYEDGGGILALREAQRLLNLPRSVSFIFVDAETPAAAEPLRAALARRFPEAQVSLSSSFAQETDDMQEMNGLIAAIGVLAMIVGAVVVANTMLMSIYERTREIGTLRAVGWRKKRILGQVIQESLLLCLLAGILGSLVGVAVMELVGRAPTLGSMLAPSWSWTIFVRAIVVAVIVGLISALYPAWRASRLRPVEALRYE